jgi:hypothetical protein
MNKDYVELDVHNLETVGRTDDESKTNFEGSSAQEKVKKTEVPKARCEEDGLQEVKVGQVEQIHGALKTIIYERDLQPLR